MSNDSLGPTLEALLFLSPDPVSTADLATAIEADEDAVDAALERFVSFLDESVGEGAWVMVLTSDHAAMPDPATTGAFQISTGVAERVLNERFDTDGDDRAAIELVHPTAVFVDERELADNGATLDDVARYAMTLTKAQVAGKGVAPAPGTEDDIAFPWAFPSDVMQALEC